MYSFHFHTNKPSLKSLDNTEILQRFVVINSKMFYSIYSMENSAAGYDPADLAKTTPFEQPHSIISHATRLVGRTILRAGLAGAFAATSLGAFGATEGKIGPTTVEASLTIDGDGEVVANIGIDNATFDFSDGPLGVRARLLKVDGDKVQKTGTKLGEQFETAATTDEILDQFDSEVDDLKTRTIQRGLGVLVLGGVTGALFAESLLGFAALQRRKRPFTAWQVVQKAGSAVIVPSLLVGASALHTSATMHKDPLAAEPRFDTDGSLNTILGSTNSLIDTLDKYRGKGVNEQFSAWYQNVLKIQDNINEKPIQLEGLVPILVVADEHSRPCTDERAQQIIDALNIPLVINAGDRTEWGQPFETEMFAGECESGIDGMDDLSAKVVAIGGNHDSKETVRAMDALDNVNVLGGQTEQINVSNLQLRILGNSDPRFTPNAIDLDEEAEEDVMNRQAQEIIAAGATDLPDIIVVHAPSLAKNIREQLPVKDVPLIISGHSHEFELDAENGLLTTGTFGAAGLRGYEYERTERNPNNTMQATIVFYDPTAKLPKYVLSLSVHADGSFGGELLAMNVDEDEAADDDAATSQKK
jgi:predicted MPP superfamily phosphohydrolase